ncbi:telomere binding protein [Exophiala xenobiotica]|uniref:Telomere binding protein n=1 Tax=Vermiconidia calcicola TaxID=1690605 RepID=A0AAV9QKY5_9PEZI|nr:telomere binding protein [Exophiala xenobiotica]KAK5545803.1 telomere binding protein [Vermiconidia calcicola]KAK5549936.1 telomere binding protein [Chaetothyriales sp. CCFEE 6169]KAK5229816.1 telomere binding protein [Exophiala xenobiotica]KAK5271603.1 telomere binding protein [Exophiala xenobiotica]
MEGLIKPVKTTRKVQNNISKFENLSLKDTSLSMPASAKSKVTILDLTPEDSDQTSDLFSLRPSVDSSHTSVSLQSSHKEHKRHDSTAFLQKSYLEQTSPASLPDDAREILKSQPDNEDLIAVLQYLQYGTEGKHDFNVRLPSPKASQIINILVTITIPDQWLHLKVHNLSKQEMQVKKLLLGCMKSVSGIGALLMQIRQLSVTNSDKTDQLLKDAISVLSLLLTGNSTLKYFLADTNKLFTSDIQRRVYWQEVTSLFAGSKVLSTMARALTSTQQSDEKAVPLWLGDGSEYSRWLARNLSTAAIISSSAGGPESSQINMLSQVLKRGLSLGYRDALVTELYTSLLLGEHALWTVMHLLLQSLPSYDQRALFDTILRDLARRFLHNNLNVEDQETMTLSMPAVGGVAAMVKGLLQNNQVLQAHLTHWLTSTNGEYTGLGLGVRRAVTATLSADHDKLQAILEKSLEIFGNKLQMQQDPILQQEVIGHLDRLSHESIKQISSSSSFIRMVSSRLSASVPRAQFLGMVVATAMSRMVDKPGKVIDFAVEEMEGGEAQQWLDLPTVQDKVGSSDDLAKPMTIAQRREATQRTPKSSRRRPVPATPPAHSAKVMAIEELSASEDSSNDEDDPELRPYARPDSDPSDSEDDPTLINRNKPSAPVYISSLIKLLSATDDPSTVKLALETAPSLIRRKAGFGDELASNLLPLASSLLNLQEGMSQQDLQQLRLEALIALFVSKPNAMGPWTASVYFEADLSLSQRAALLTVLALGAREIAGVDDGLEKIATQFPSNRLLPRLESIYASQQSPVNTISTTLFHRTLQPMALSAADKLSGPDILKVRTFSSRMAVAAKEAAKSEARSKRIPKDLHKLLSESIYLPFCSRLTLLLSSRASSPYLANSTLLHASLVRLSIQTLIVLVSTLGPNAFQLATVTRESLLLLLAIHAIPTLAHDPVILPAILHLLLALLELNIEAGSTAEERLVTDFGSMVAELVSWAAGLGERVSIPEVHGEKGLGMAMPWPVLVAGVQVKWQEVGRKFQGRMLGLMATTDFDSF